MATELSDLAANAAANAVTALLNGGTMEYQTAADAEVATIALGDPAFAAADAGDSDPGEAEMNSATADSDATGGEIAKAVFKASGGAEVYRVAVTDPEGGGEIIFPSTESLTIGAGDTVGLTAFTYKHPKTV